MSQNTEQNVQTREEQISMMAEFIRTGPSGKGLEGWLLAHIRSAEARGAAEQRRKDAEDNRPRFFIQHDGGGLWEYTEKEWADDDFYTPSNKFVFYCRPANVAALESKTERRFQHIKRGTEYRLIGRGKIQQNGPSDMAEVVIYQDVNDGSFWVRSPSEFYDGRFKEIFDALTREGGV